MRRLFRYTLIALLTLVLMLAIALTYLSSKLNEETVLPLLQQQLKQQTGLDLRMVGALHWRIFPDLLIEVNELAMHTEQAYNGDTLFAKIDRFALGIDWKKLFDRELHFDSLSINDATIRLVKPHNSNGNWQTTASSATDNPDQRPARPQNIAALALVFEELSLGNIKIEYHDHKAATQHEAILSKLHASNIQLDGQPFGINLTILYSDNHRLKSELTYTSLLAADLNAGLLELSSIKGQLDNIRFNGEATINDFAKAPAVTAKLQFDEINLNHYQGSNDAAAAAAAAAAAKPQNSSKEAVQPSPLLALAALPNAKLDLKVSKLLHNRVALKNITAGIDINKGYVSIMPVTADAFGGKITARLSLDRTASTPVLRSHSLFENVQLERLLSSFDMSADISGVLTADAETVMQGSSTSQWLNSLNGTSKFSITQGVYHKENIERRVCQAIALARNAKLSSQWPASTPFIASNVNIQWRNGVGEITSLSGGLENMQLSGTGQLLAFNQSAELRLQAIITGDLQAKDPGCVINEKYREIAWPIRCTANTGASQCGIDQPAMEKIISTTLQNELQQIINKNLDGKFGEQLGETLRQWLK